MLTALILHAWFATASAQDGPPIVTTPVLDVRPRVHHGYTEGLSRGFLTRAAPFTRSRVGLEVSRGTVTGRVVLQHLIGWEFLPPDVAQDAPGYGRIPPALGLAEGWGRLNAKLPAGVTLDITFGRQLVTLHRGRLISENDWFIAARPIDAMDVVLRLGDFQMRVMNFRDFSDAGALLDPGSTLITVGGKRVDPLRSYTFDVVMLIETLEADVRFTFGPFWEFRRGRFALTTEGYLQIEDPDSEPSEILPTEGSSLAAMGALEVGWTFGPERLLYTAVGVDLTTHRLELPGARGGWAAPLGDGYRFYGHMNLFRRSEDTAHRGLVDLFGLVVSKPVPRLDLELKLHAFWTTWDPVFLGVEADATVRYRFTPFASAEIGYAHFRQGPGLASITTLSGPYGTGYGDIRVKF